MNLFNPGGAHGPSMWGNGNDNGQRPRDGHAMGGLAGLARRLFPNRFQQPTGQPPAQMPSPQTGGGLAPSTMPQMQTGGGMQPSQMPQPMTGGGAQPSTLGQMYQTGGGYQPQPYSGYPNLQTGGGAQPQSAYQKPQGRGLLSMWQQGRQNPYGWGFGNER